MSVPKLDFLNLLPDAVDERARTQPFELSDIPGYLNAAANFNSIDDRKFLLEKLVTLMSRLPNTPAANKFSKGLQSTFIDILYKDLPHPPSTYLSMLPQNTSTESKVNPIKFAYRNADASNYVPLFPGLGKSNAPYARSVPATNFTPPATLPDAGLVFDTLMRRDAFEPHPAGISSLFFAFADLIIHSIFNTSPADPTINLASSYLDLSILYGSNEEQLKTVRNKDGRGRLYEDTFADSRLLFMPPSTCALLVVLSRNHNFNAQKILEINEGGTYTTTFKNDDAMREQDDEIFNRARLVNCGYFMQIILGDYVGAILRLVEDGYSWRLDPLSQSREITHDLTPRGEGNVVSIEFNLLYRWHACISEKDTEWTENLFKEMFGTEDFDNITIPQFMNVAKEKMVTDPDTRKWTFNKLQRGPDGRFKDSDLAEILHNATSWRAGAYGARAIPEVLRVIEVLGIEQARRWGACSMNDFRRFLGLKPYDSFQEWNPNPKVADAAAKLYKDIENLELYVGLQAEQTKTPMAGAGLCPGYTISRSILADAVCLTRGDRFLTVEFTPYNLTAWGYRDCQFDPQDGSYGGMLTKLLFRTLPEYYPARSAYAHFPFLDPLYMRDHMRANNAKLATQYVWTRPPLPPHAENVVVVKTPAGVREVLEKHEVFPPDYTERVKTVAGLATLDLAVDHAWVNKEIMAEAGRWSEYFGAETERLIAKRSLDHIGKDGTVKYLDVVRDVINVLPVHWICQQLAGLPLKDDMNDEQRQYESFSDVCRYIFLNSEPSNDWRLRESSVQTYQNFEKVVKSHLSSLLQILDADRAFASAESRAFLHKLYSQVSDVNKLSAALFTEVVPTAAQWSHAIAHVINFYLDDSRAQVRQEIVELAAKRTPHANEQVAVHVRDALAEDPPVWGVYRTAQAETTVDSVKIPVGTRVFASVKDANASTREHPILGIGENGLLSVNLFELTATQVLGKILALKHLKRAPGTSGKFNRFIETVHGAETAHGAPQQWYVNARADLVPWPESLVVQYNL
ncbi:heme peroxidase [Mycena maculata]|uniref:Heme peroxidase n=1 Tax=Mycena maculata TaxID=230809 RepID=A0AAD7IFN1_9AGAR|nr:heme peroxidase [Mycena maculata]